MKYLTNQPGIGGDIKRYCEDFFVEELPLFSPSGDGEHTFFEVEKLGMTTLEAARRIAGALGVPIESVGFAGMKDSRSVSRQWMSLWKIPPERILSLDIAGLKVLQAKKHNQKLKAGQLSGNRFRIIVRGVGRSALEAAGDIFSVLVRRGVPNYFGEQRFGVSGNGHLIGKAILEGDYGLALKIFVCARDDRRLLESFERGELDKAREMIPVGFFYERACLKRLMTSGPEAAMTTALPKKLLRLFVSAYHSHLFNRILERRMDTMDALFEGDLAVFGFRGGRHFRASGADAADEKTRERLKSFEISPSGPVPGRKVELAGGLQGAIELDVLKDFDLSRARNRGTRRPLRFPIHGLGIGFKEPDALEVKFTLPMGCYATAVMREVMKHRENQ